MENNDERREKDELSEILSRNKERRQKEEHNDVSSDMDKTGVFSEELFGSGKNEQNAVPDSLNAKRINEAEEMDEEELHDIEFDEETEKPNSDKAFKRAR